MWREGITDGNFRAMVRKPGEVVGKTDTKGVMDVCHIIIVPPWALALTRERSWSWESSEFRNES